MGTEVERTDGNMPTSTEDDLRALEENYAALRDETQQLIQKAQQTHHHRALIIIRKVFYDLYLRVKYLIKRENYDASRV